MTDATLLGQLEIKRRSERRTCDECGYAVENPFYERCPRCNHLLPKLELYCTGCIVSSACPVWKEHSGGENAPNQDLQGSG